jgi:hypothetical protein
MEGKQPAGNCIMRSCRICTPYYRECNQNNENLTARGNMRHAYKFLAGKLKGKIAS